MAMQCKYFQNGLFVILCVIGIDVNLLYIQIWLQVLHCIKKCLNWKS